jgi:phosphoribosylaminoimidazolecarboxamide formyltransferase/IMP cyclohydrolase
MRRRFAAKVFSTLSRYDGAIAGYFTSLTNEEVKETDLPTECSITLSKVTDLRYGENPHQRAALYRGNSRALKLFSGPVWEQLGGKELSYNNMLDLDAGLRLLSDLPQGRTVAGILKHLNPCGVAAGATVTGAIKRAKQCDPRSHFGGVLLCNTAIDAEAAEEIRGDFAELVIAPDFIGGAVDILRTSKNLRILKVEVPKLTGYDLRTVAGGVLIQEPDIDRSRVANAALASHRVPSDEELLDLELAWRIVGHVKSNAIVLVRDGLLIGVGAGQMSRIDSVELAIRKAKVHGHLLNGAVAASDAFFPFPDSVETLADEGITCVVSPAGARRDDDVKVVANARNLSLFFASDRHFRH